MTPRPPRRRRTLTSTGACWPLRRELGLGRGSLAWAEEWCTDTCLAFLNGTTLVLINVGHEPVELPAGRVLLRSSQDPPGTGPSHLDRPAPGIG